MPVDLEIDIVCEWAGGRDASFVPVVSGKMCRLVLDRREVIKRRIGLAIDGELNPVIQEDIGHRPVLGPEEDCPSVRSVLPLSPAISNLEVYNDER